MSSPEEQDAVDPQAYIQSTFNIGSLLLSYGFKAEHGLAYGWWSRTVGDRYYRVVFDDDDITSTGEIWHVNGRGEHHRVLVTNHFSKVSQLDNWLKTHFKRTESIEDEDNPQAYISGALDTESVLKRNGFTYEGTSTLNKQHWLKWLTKRKVISVIVDVNLEDEERWRKASLGASGIGPIDYRVLKTCKDKDTEGDFQVLHRAFGINVLRLQSKLAELNRRTESAEDDDVDPAAFAASTLDHATALAELGFLQHSLPGHKELWVSKIGNRNIQVEPMDDGRLMCRIYRWNVNSWKTPTSLDLITGMACDSVPELRKYIAARSVPATPLTAESAELVHRLLDAIPDALEPLGEIDQLVEPRCPACESTDVTEKDAENLCDCMHCGIWFKPDALTESDHDDPSSYISQLPSRVDHLATLVANRTCTKEEAVEYASIQAESVLHLFEKDFPDDKRPRQAIEAARKWWREPSEANRLAANDAANAAYAADAAAFAASAAYATADADAARAASYAAAAAAVAASAAYANAYANADANAADAAAYWADKARKEAAVAARKAGKERKRVRESLEDEIGDLKAYALQHGNGPQNQRIVTTFSTITPESAAQGDFAETGWEDEEGFDCTPDEFDEEEGKTVADIAAKFIYEKGAVSQSSSHFYPGAWYSTDMQDTDFVTGEQTEHNFHLVGFTPEQEQEVWNKFMQLLRPRN